MRKKGLVFLMVVAALFCIWSFVLSDRWMEKRLESLLGRVVGAKVEIEKFDFSLFGMSVQWARLQVADPDDPWRNLFETGYCAFDLESAPLFEKKFIVKDMSLLEFRLDTERNTDGSLEEKSQRRKGPSRIKTSIQKKLEQKLSELPLFNADTLVQGIDIDELWNSIAPQSPERINEIIKEYETLTSEWDERLEELDIERELIAIRDELESIDVERVETVEQLRSTAEKLDRVAEKTERINETIGRQKEELGQEVTGFSTRTAALEGWLEEDLGRVENAVQIPEITLKNVAVIMFGRKLVDRVEKVIRIVEKFRAITAKIRRFIPIKELPPRLRGQDIRFSKSRDLPTLWLKHISFSGYIRDNMQITGTLHDFSSGQHLTGKPTELEVTGGMAGTRNFVLEGHFDWREAVPNDRISVEMSNILLNDVQLTDFPLIPNRIEKGIASLGGELLLEGEELRSNIYFFIEDVTLALPEWEVSSPVEQRLFEVSRSVAADIDRIEIEAGLAILSYRTDVSVRSNLDALVAGKVNEVLEREIAGVKDELEKRVIAVTAESKKELDRIIGDVEESFLVRLGELESLGDRVEKEIEKKRQKVEARIKDQTVGKKQRELEEEKRRQEEELRRDLELQKEQIVPEKPKIPEESKVPQDIKKGIESLF